MVLRISQRDEAGSLLQIDGSYSTVQRFLEAPCLTTYITGFLLIFFQ
jgi:hypothetical protein